MPKHRPKPIKYAHGKLSVDRVWQRLAIDIMHYKSKAYLSCEDCCRCYIILRAQNSESASTIVRHVTEIFREHGIPDEVLADNGPNFRRVFRQPEYSAFEQLCLQASG